MKKSRKGHSVNVRRWVSYAAAGAAAAVAASNDAEATVYYSGVLNTVLKHTGTSSISFPVSIKLPPLSHPISNSYSALFWMSQTNHPANKAHDQVDAFSFANNETNLRMAGFKSAAARYNSISLFASRLGAGVKIASQHLYPHQSSNNSFLLAAGSHGAPYEFAGAGTTGFLAFDFDISGTPFYGWAQIKNIGNSNGRGGNSPNVNDIELLGYAYSDNANFLTGQTATPEPASVALLALGGAGLLAFRKSQKTKKAKVA